LVEIKPFKGLRFSENIDISKVVAPPYDIISDSVKKILLNESPYNIVRITLGRDETGYKNAAKLFQEWIGAGILTQDKNDSIYVYEQEFEHDGKILSCIGFIALLKLEEPGKNIFEHEKTLEEPKEDRLLLMKECKANLSPVYMFYRNYGKIKDVLERSATQKPLVDFIDHKNIRHRLWAITDMKDIQTIANEMAQKKVFIADGHHRYATSLHYKKENENAKYVMTLFAEINDSGVILPTHRLIRCEINKDKALRKIEEFFEIEKVEKRNILLKMKESNKMVFGAYFGEGNCYLLYPKNDFNLKIEPILKKLDVNILHEIIIKKIFGVGNNDILYTKNLIECFKMVDNNEADVALLLNPINIQDIEEIALNNQRTPPKTTYFYPKPLTGLVFYKF